MACTCLGPLSKLSNVNPNDTSSSTAGVQLPHTFHTTTRNFSDDHLTKLDCCQELLSGIMRCRPQFCLPDFAMYRDPRARDDTPALRTGFYVLETLLRDFFLDSWGGLEIKLNVASIKHWSWACLYIEKRPKTDAGRDNRVMFLRVDDSSRVIFLDHNCLPV